MKESYGVDSSTEESTPFQFGQNPDFESTPMTHDSRSQTSLLDSKLLGTREFWPYLYIEQ